MAQNQEQAQESISEQKYLVAHSGRTLVLFSNYENANYTTT